MWINCNPNYPVINEWFINNPRFLLGDLADNNLRGNNGGRSQTLALVSRPGQDVISDLRTALNCILGEKTMALDFNKFVSNSAYCFILQCDQNQKRINIYFPADGVASPKLMYQLTVAGFQKQVDHFYAAPYTPELAQKARFWVERCKDFGAVEVERIEDLKPCRGTRMIDAIREVVREEIAVLKEQLREDVKAEIEALRNKNEQLAHEVDFHKAAADALRSHAEEADIETARLSREAEFTKAQYLELRTQLNASQDEVERLKAIGQEWGINPPPEPVLEDEEPDLEGGFDFDLLPTVGSKSN